jgi:hypothetical protein
MDRFIHPAGARLPAEATGQAYLKARVIGEAHEVRLVTEAAQGWCEGTVSSRFCIMQSRPSVPGGAWCPQDLPHVRRKCSMR